MPLSIHTKTNAPLVSIITITRNRALLISRCIESIQNQTYQNYEHIIVDGNSTDNTREIVEEYASKDPKIIYIHLDLCGPRQQQEQGFLQSRGEFITFLDDDDEYLSNNLEKKLELILSLPLEYGFIYGPMDYFDDKTGMYLYTHEAKLEGGIEILPKAIEEGYISGTPSIMYRRIVFAEIGGTYISGIGNEMSDWALTTRALSLGWKVAAYNKSLVKIYVNHCYDRMTNYTAHGVSGAKRMVLFHQYFLNEYSALIKSNPKSGKIHYLSLVYSFVLLGDFCNVFAFYKKLLSSSPTFKNFIYPIYVLIKYKWLKR